MFLESGRQHSPWLLQEERGSREDQQGVSETEDERGSF